ncbi:hypothetical protein KKE26_09060 [bacterium]|nr:hypothetical protein [bacterium]MBU1754471.1 hypothetical protein [bacterium]
MVSVQQSVVSITHPLIPPAVDKHCGKHLWHRQSTFSRGDAENAEREKPLAGGSTSDTGSRKAMNASSCLDFMVWSFN